MTETFQHNELHRSLMGTWPRLHDLELTHPLFVYGRRRGEKKKHHNASCYSKSSEGCFVILICKEIIMANTA